MAITITTDIVLLIYIKTENEFAMAMNEKMETLHKQTKKLRVQNKTVQ